MMTEVHTNVGCLKTHLSALLYIFCTDTMIYYRDLSTYNPERKSHYMLLV